MAFYRHFIFVLIMFPGAMCAQVDGFNKGKGNMDLVLSLGYEQGLGYYLADGKSSLKRFRASAALFAARGLTDDLDLQVSVPLVITNGAFGLQDGQVFLKYLPLKAKAGNGRIAFGAAVGASAPLSDYGTEGISAIGQQATSLIPMGVLQYTAGSGFFTSVVAGQAIVQAPTPDALIGTFRLGHASGEHYVEGYVQAQEAYGGKDYLGQGEQAPSTFRELGVSFIKVGAKYYKPFGGRWGWVVEANYVVAGRNIDQAVAGAFSFIMHFRK